MNILTVINAKGGCGKSTIAMNLAAGLAARGDSTLLIDMDPQAQVSEWLHIGDGLEIADTLTAVMAGRQPLHEVIQPTDMDNLSFVASSEPLETLGRQITDREGYSMLLAAELAREEMPAFDWIVLDSPNQISPIMENAIFPADLFVVPFEGTKSVKSYANVFTLISRLRPDLEYRMLHVLSNVSRLPGLRNKVLEMLRHDQIELADTEIRSCGWLAQVDEHGGSIFSYRPYSNGAEDLATLVEEVAGMFEPNDQDEKVGTPQPADLVEVPRYDQDKPTHDDLAA